MKNKDLEMLYQGTDITKLEQPKKVMPAIETIMFFILWIMVLFFMFKWQAVKEDRDWIIENKSEWCLTH